MRKSIYFTKLIPLIVMLLCAILFFLPLQLLTQQLIRPLQQPGATVPLYSGWVKIEDSLLPTIKFNRGKLGGQAVNQIGKYLYQISNFILPIGVLITMIFTFFLILGLELRDKIERKYFNSHSK